MSRLWIALTVLALSPAAHAQQFSLTSTDSLSLSAVAAAPSSFAGVPALKLEIAPDAHPGSGFIDTATVALVRGTEGFHDGVIEVTVASTLAPSALPGARGFVGLAFRIARDRDRFEAFYVRPTNGRADDQVRRNHTTQYLSFPGHDFARLRVEAPEKYESYADIGPGEWIRLRIEVAGEHARLFVNGAAQPTLVVDDLKMGPDATGAIGLWIYNGTIAHFRDLRVTRR